MNYAPTTRPISSVPKGFDLARAAIVLAHTKDTPGAALSFSDTFRDTPTVRQYFELQTKGEVGAGALTDWGSSLGTTGIWSDSLNLLPPLSPFDAATTKMRQVPFQFQVPRQTGAGTGGGWVQEGGPVPAISFAFDTLMLEPTKVMALVVFTKEFLRVGNEAPIRDALLNAVAGYVATQFLDPSVNNNIPVSPASITNGATAIASTGGSAPTAAQLIADLGSMIAAITTTGGGLTWIMRPTTLARIALVLGGAATDVPRTLFGIPLIVSKNAGAQITLVDLNEITYAAGGLEIELSSRAAVQMETEPTNQSTLVGSPEGTTPTNLVSLFQTNSVCFKVLRYLNWERVRGGSVAYMAVAY